MSATAEQLFDALAPAYSADPLKSVYIEIATSRTNACAFGTQANLAIALRAAHMLVLSKRSTGEAGQVASKSEGDLSLSYFSAGDPTGDDLSLTHYGKQLMGLLKGNIPAVGVTGGLDDGCDPGQGPWVE